MICHVNTAQLVAAGTFLMCWDLGSNLGILKFSTLLCMGFKGVVKLELVYVIGKDPKICSASTTQLVVGNCYDI